MQMELMGEILKITKHAPQRWLSLINTLERIIRLWNVLLAHYSNIDEVFPLEVKKQAILELYSLMEPVCSITRIGQNGTLPMNGKMHLAFSRLKATTLNPSKSLEVRIPRDEAAITLL